MYWAAKGSQHSNIGSIQIILPRIMSRGSGPRPVSKADSLTAYTSLVHFGVDLVTKHKFMFPMHNEVKQTEISEFGAENDLLRGQARAGGSYSIKNPELPKAFQQSPFLKAKSGTGGSCRVSDQLLPVQLVDGGQYLGARRSRGCELRIIR